MLWDPEAHLPEAQASRNLAEEATLLLGMRSLSETNIMPNLEKLTLE